MTGHYGGALLTLCHKSLPAISPFGFALANKQPTRAASILALICLLFLAARPFLVVQHEVHYSDVIGVICEFN
jgi:hypothetical protein